MPLRIPVCIPYTIGTDIVHINRIRALISGRLQPNDGGRRLSRFLDRILHPLERQDFNRKFPALINVSGNHGLSAQVPETTGTWLAGRWAAKEAAKKAWGAQMLGFKDVRVEVCDGGEVQMVCSGWRTPAIGQSPERAEQLGRLSISHDGEYAIATVMATPLQITPADLQLASVAVATRIAMYVAFSQQSTAVGANTGPQRIQSTQKATPVFLMSECEDFVQQHLEHKLANTSPLDSPSTATSHNIRYIVIGHLVVFSPIVRQDSNLKQSMLANFDVEMPQAKKVQPQKAWEALDPQIGMSTRGRKSRSDVNGMSSLNYQQPTPPTSSPRPRNPRRCHHLNSSRSRTCATSAHIGFQSSTERPEVTEQSERSRGADTTKAGQVARRPVIEESSADEESDPFIDQDIRDDVSYAEHKGITTNASEAAVVSRSIVAGACKRLVLSILGDLNAWNNDFNLYSAQDDVHVRFVTESGLIFPGDTIPEANQFIAAITSALFTTKVKLKCSAPGYNLDALVCTVEKVLPHLGSFADLMDLVSTPRALGTKRIWSLLMWVMKEIVTVEFGIVPLHWSEAGIVALEMLDEFAQNVVVQLVYSLPASGMDGDLYARYREMKWLSEDLEILCRYAAFADYFKGRLGKGWYLEETIREMKRQAERIATQ